MSHMGCAGIIRFQINQIRFYCKNAINKSVFKIPRSQENKFARNFMKNKAKYELYPSHRDFQLKKGVLSTNFDQSRAIAGNLIVNLENAVQKTWSENKNIDELVNLTDSFVKNSVQISTDDFVHALETYTTIYAIPEILKSPAYAKLQTDLNAICVAQINEWNINTLLRVSGIWLRLPSGIETPFYQLACETLINHVNSMSAQQLVQTLFCLKCLMKPVRKLEIFENHLEQKIDELSLEELSIALMVFYRNNTRLKNTAFVLQIYNKMLEENLEVLPRIAVTGFIKILRLSNDDIYSELATSLFNKIRDIELQFLPSIHLLLFVAKFHIYDEGFIETIVYRSLNELKNVRLKDLSILLYASVKFGFLSNTSLEKSFFETILENLKNRLNEAQQHPRSFIDCLCYLATKGFYNTDLLEFVTELIHPKPLLVEPIYSNRNLLFLDSFARVNLKHVFNDSLLNDQERSNLASRICLNHVILFNGAQDVVSELYFNYKIDRALPYFVDPDIFIVFDTKKKCAVNRNKYFPPEFSGQIIDKKLLVAENDDLEVVVIVYAGPQFYIRNKNGDDFTGSFKFKIDQLKYLGFLPIVISHIEWKLKSRGQRKELICDKTMHALSRRH